MSPIIFAFVLVLIINLALLPSAYKSQSFKHAGVAYAMSFGILTVYGFIGGISITSSFKLLLTALLMIWAIRLGFFQMALAAKLGKKARLRKKMSSPINFLNRFLLQAVASWVISLPFLFRLLQDSAVESSFQDITIIEWTGLIIALIGLTIESITDVRKARFTAVVDNENTVFETGVHKISNYPNYIGEILFWLGIFIACIAAIHGSNWLAILSPICIVLLLFLTKYIPTAEEKRKDIHSDPVQNSPSNDIKHLIDIHFSNVI